MLSEGTRLSGVRHVRTRRSPVRLETEIKIAETLREVHLVGNDQVSFAARANRLLRRGRVSISIELRISLRARDSYVT